MIREVIKYFTYEDFLAFCHTCKRYNSFLNDIYLQDSPAIQRYEREIGQGILWPG